MEVPLASPRPEQLGLWQRFHVRLGLTYGALVLLVLTGLAMGLYQIAVNTAISGVQGQLSGVAVAMAAALPPERATAAAQDPAAHEALVAQLRAVLAAQPEIESVYVLLRTDNPDALVFAGDIMRRGRTAGIGERYDVRKAPRMREGLVAPAVETAPYTDDFGTFLSGYAPLLDGAGASIGLVGVDIRMDEVAAMKRRLLLWTGGIYTVALLALAGVAAGVGRNLRAPLERLLEATAAVEAGALDTRTQLRRADEFGILGANFDRMAAGLQERELIRDTFGRYVSREVARQILSGPDAAQLGGDSREVTVLFSDVRGYSTLSERLPPERVVALMNEYFGAMSEVIEARGGTVIEFLGDGILVAFGAPGRMPDHATAAVETALAMRARLATLNAAWEEAGVARLWTELGLGRLGARIGVHTGLVVAGNLGSPRRMKYAVIGDTVNVASRVEGLNNALGTDVLFTEATAAQLPADLRARAEDRGEHLLKGRAHPVRVYTIPAQVLLP